MTNPKGIPNIGNTCFANSVLQVLGQTELLRNLLFDCQGGTAYMLKTLLDDLNTCDKRCVNESLVSRLLSSVFKRDGSFRLGRQDDSHSFFLSLLECVQADSGGNPYGIFEGMMKNRFEYDKCSHLDDSEEQRFTSLLMPIDNHKDLRDCIEDFRRMEEFEENLIQCRKCITKQQDTKATRRTVLTRLPEILVLQMGRFAEYITATGIKRIRKNNGKIRFVTEMNLTEEHEGKDIPYDYDLYGVVSHTGTIEGGHYTAAVKVGTKWWYCSDRYIVHGANPAEDPSAGPYLLFYRRRGKGLMITDLQSRTTHQDTNMEANV
ncbi:uncharacterized protein [Argopecten irradians]|uniref:uncharacterized protein n=1 Tax=Argopecten irradians TaxID=31199 RepID=UPI00371AF718